MATVLDLLSDDSIYTVVQLARLSKVPTAHVRKWLAEHEIKPTPALSLGDWYSGKEVKDALRLGACIQMPSKYDAAAQTRALMESK